MICTKKKIKLLLKKYRAIDKYFETFINGVFEGYGNDGFIEYGRPDGKMLEALINNCYFFSEAKTRSQLETLSHGLFNPSNRQIRSYKEFKEFATTVIANHVDSWLKAEYNLAINCAQMSSKWVEIQRDKALFPQLEFDAMIDGRTTSQCRHFHGKVFDVDDPIWNTIYPPNHWGCRSTVRKVRGRKTDSSADINIDSIQEGFRTNMAKDGMPWPKNSAYYKTDSYEQIESEKGNAAFKLVDRPEKKGVVFESQMAAKPQKSAANMHEYKVRMEAADALAHHYGETFFVMPEMEANDARHGLYFPNLPYANKTPDLKSKEYWDVANIDKKLSKKTLDHIFGKYGKQVDNVAIVITNMQEKDFEKVYSKIKRKTAKGGLAVIYNGKVY
jgi:SPP1 gp7 family putative phage head morphogenesis protein